MGKVQMWFEVIQVISRKDGRISLWYPGDKRATLDQAQAEQRSLTEEFPDVEYQVIETRMTEIGVPRIGRVKSMSVSIAERVL